MLLGVALRKALHFLHSYAKRRKDESAVEGLVIIQAGVFGMGVSAKINTRGSKHFGFKLGMVGIS